MPLIQAHFWGAYVRGFLYQSQETSFYKGYRMKLSNDIEIYNGDNIDLLPKIKNNSINAIITDPPYQYLKHKLDVPFDEEKFFNHAKRVLKKDGFIVMFGRGEAFYRWNTMLSNRGFLFKEEIIWNKVMTSSPLLKLNRVHETVSIYTKKDGVINKVRVPYLEMKGHDIGAIKKDIKPITMDITIVGPSNPVFKRNIINTEIVANTEARAGSFMVFPGDNNADINPPTPERTTNIIQKASLELPNIPDKTNLKK